MELNNTNDIIFYNTPKGNVRIEVIFKDETFWLTQKKMAELFGVEVPAISKHLKNIYAEGELQANSTISKMETVVNRGFRGEIKEKIDFYNLDAIIAVGYRVNSINATQFRIWATKTLKEYIIKGFVLDDERLKQGKQFGKDYFDELLARIREIRASEKRFYQKVKDLFALSKDYKENQKETDQFFAYTQNKLLYATTTHTAAEIILLRAKAEMPNMGLLSFKGSRVRKEDVIIAKNYLTENEIDTLNRLVALFLDSAELRVQEQTELSLSYWKEEVDNIIAFSRKKILTGQGTKSHDQAVQFVENEYKKFDANRKKIEIQQADQEDKKAIDALIKKAKKK
jgi:hypothetical protein